MITQDHRRLAAIVSADVVGYSGLMERDESGTLAALKAHQREVMEPKVAEHHGRIVKTTGDGLLLEFGSVVDAVRCAVEVQRTMALRNAVVPPQRQIQFRIGINVGDIIIDRDDIFGDGVNVAARLQALAEPGGIYVSQVVRDQVQDKLDFTFVWDGIHSAALADARDHRVAGDAWNAFLRVSDTWNRSGDAIAARKQMEELLRQFPDFVPALAMLSDTIAVQLAGTSAPDGARVRRDFEEMDRVTGRAVALGPSDSYAWTVRADALTWLGRWDEALAASARAQALDPAACCACGTRRPSCCVRVARTKL